MPDDTDELQCSGPCDDTHPRHDMILDDSGAWMCQDCAGIELRLAPYRPPGPGPAEAVGGRDGLTRPLGDPDEAGHRRVLTTPPHSA